jgi:hypothetical protein
VSGCLESRRSNRKRRRGRRKRWRKKRRWKPKTDSSPSKPSRFLRRLVAHSTLINPPPSDSLFIWSQEFKLPNDVQSLFGVEVQEDHPKAKDHMAVSKGEQVYVLLINHPKLPNDRYFIEKDDGTSEHDYI